MEDAREIVEFSLPRTDPPRVVVFWVWGELVICSCGCYGFRHIEGHKYECNQCQKPYEAVIYLDDEKGGNDGSA